MFQLLLTAGDTVEHKDYHFVSCKRRLSSKNKSATKINQLPHQFVLIREKFWYQ